MGKKALFLFAITFLALSVVFSPKVLAEDSTSSGTSTQTPKPGLFNTFDRKPVTASTISGEKRIKRIDRLVDNRLKFCENHQDEINKRLTSLGSLVTNMLGKFSAIAVRVEQFYTNKVLPSGKTVPNYQQLVDDVAAKNSAVTLAFSNAQADVKDFKCTAEDPKGQLKLFRTDMQLVKKALQDYRTSIRNLIVAVKSVTGDTENEASKSGVISKPEATEKP